MKYKLSDIMDIIGGGTPKTSIPEYWGGSIPWLSVKDFNNDNRYVYETEKNITEEGLNHSSTTLLKKNDIIISARGTVGEVAMIYFPMAFNQSCYGLRARENIVDSTFLYYLVKHNVRVLKKNTHGSVFDTITRDTFAGIEVDLPDKQYQIKIGSFLALLDDKLELNKKINENLQEQAQAIFKSWFVDFEPFGGVMPTNWCVDKLGSFVEIKRGGSPRPIQEYLSNTGYRWLKTSDVTSLNSPYILDIKEHIKDSGLKKTVFLRQGSLVLSNSATPGIPKILDVDSCIHDGWLYFPKSKLSNEYLYLLFKFIRNDLVKLGNGSVFTNLKTDILRQFEIVMPSSDILSDFQIIVIPMFEKMKSVARENHRLAALRDTLLPKLMNGEIDVGKIII